MTAADRARAIGVELELADRSLRSARLLLGDGDGNGSINRLYYGLYHAVRAALVYRNIVPPKSHSGLIAAFGSNFVRTGEFPISLGKLINRVEQVRLLADYSGDTIETSEVPELIGQGDTFVETVRAFARATPTK